MSQSSPRSNRTLSTSPLAATSSGQPSSPVTPSPSIRARKNHNSPDQSSSTTVSGSDSRPISLMNDIPSSTFRNLFASSNSTHRSQIILRSDASLVTCFDSLDKELYDLWAPHM